MVETNAMVVRLHVVHLWLTRFLAVLLMLGGAGGAVIYMLMADQWLSQQWTDTFQAIVLLTVYIISMSVGVCLWRYKNYGRMWAAVLLLLQTPIFISKSVSYEWFTGVSIKLLSSNGRFRWSAEVGGSDNFHPFPDFVGMVYGINVFAFCAALYLLIAYIKTSQNHIDS